MLKGIELGKDEGWYKNKGVQESFYKLMRNTQRMREKNPNVVEVMLAVWEKLLWSFGKTGLVSEEGVNYLMQELGHLRMGL